MLAGATVVYSGPPRAGRVGWRCTRSDAILAHDGAHEEEAVTMVGTTLVSTLAQGGVTTTGLQRWIQDNVVPLILLTIAVILLWIGGRGDNAGVARRSVGLIIGLVALGIAVSGQGPNLGRFLAGLITG
jgi:hypothetical protein